MGTGMGKKQDKMPQSLLFILRLNCFIEETLLDYCDHSLISRLEKVASDSFYQCSCYSYWEIDFRGFSLHHSGSFIPLYYDFYV